MITHGSSPTPTQDSLRWLQLLQLADSAVPIGSTAHSFGLETLVEYRLVTVETLPATFRDFLREAGTLESVFCVAACSTKNPADIPAWCDLNATLDALRTARESRTASTTLGRRFLQLAASLTDDATLRAAVESAKMRGVGIHHSTAFGLVGGCLCIDAESTALAFLQQMTMGLLSACQRLMPLGQQAASRILWDLKPAMLHAVRRAALFTPDTVPLFTPTLDIGSMLHPALTTRLFIS